MRGADLELARRAYREIALYSVDRSPCAVDVSDNTNLFGIPPAAERTSRRAALSAGEGRSAALAPTASGNSVPAAPPHS